MKTLIIDHQKYTTLQILADFVGIPTTTAALRHLDAFDLQLADSLRIYRNLNKHQRLGLGLSPKSSRTALFLVDETLAYLQKPRPFKLKDGRKIPANPNRITNTY